MMPYVKANSFVHAVAEQKVIKSAKKLALKALEEKDLIPPGKESILKKVKNDLSSSPKPGTAHFQLLPHSAAELNKVAKERIPDYLYHRYRYDIFPITNELDAYPPCLQIEPASVCNFRCVFCYQTDTELTKKINGHMGFMEIDLLKSIVDQAEDNIEFVTLASRGEPTIHPKFNELMEYLTDKFLGLKINTNASRLTEEKCHAILQSNASTIVFSADAATEPLYSSMRVNGKLDQTLANVENFQKIRSKHYPQSSIISRVSGVKFSKEQTIEDMEGTWGELVDQVAFVDYNPWENSYKRKPSNVSQPCSDLWRRMFIWWDGKANPCDVDYLSKLQVGNSSDLSVSDLWKSKAYQILRTNHLYKDRDKIEPCRRCTVI